MFAVTSRTRGPHGASTGASEDMPERRTTERRIGERRRAGESVDVTRIEHENLTRQVEDNILALRRLEAEVRRLRDRLDQLTSPQKRTG